MAEGIEVEVIDGFAHIQFLTREAKGNGLAALLEAVGPGVIDVDTRSNPRKTYIVPEGTAAEAGLIDGEPVVEAPVTGEGEPSLDWTVAQLLAFAQVHAIDLGGATKKADILAAIQAAQAPAEPVVDTPPVE